MTKKEHRNIYRWVHSNSYRASSFFEQKVIDLEEFLEYFKAYEPAPLLEPNGTCAPCFKAKGKRGRRLKDKTKPCDFCGEIEI